MDTTRFSTLKEFHFVNIDPQITNLIAEEIEMNLIQNLSIMPTKSELISSPDQNENDIEMMPTNEPNNNEIIYHRDNETFISCQVCRQRTRSWLEISACSHKYKYKSCQI